MAGLTTRKLQEEKKLYKEEQHDEVTMRTYQKYIAACGGFCRALMVLLVLMIYQLLG